MAGTVYKIAKTEKAPADTTHPYAKISKEALQLAGANLSPKGFCCWIHFSALPALTKSSYNVIPNDISKVIPYSKDSIQDALKELIAKRYLIPTGEKLTYIFHEIAVPEVESPIQQDETPNELPRPQIDTSVIVGGKRFDF